MSDQTPLPAPVEDDWTPQKMAKLARELVLRMKADDKILADFNLTPHDFVTKIRQHPFFKQVFQATCIEWNSALKGADRLQVQALTILEDGLPKLGARMTNPKEPLPAAVQAATLLAKMGGLGEPTRKEGSTSEKFTITINLGAGDERKFEKTIEAKVEPSLLQEPSPNAQIPRESPISGY